MKAKHRLAVFRTLVAACVLFDISEIAYTQTSFDALSFGSGFNMVGYHASVGWTFVPAVDMRVVAVGCQPFVPKGFPVDFHFWDSTNGIIATYPIILTSETNLNLQAVNGLTLRKGSQYGISITNPEAGNLVFTVYSRQGLDGIRSFGVSPYLNQFANFEVSGDGQWGAMPTSGNSDWLFLGPTFQFQVLSELSISQTGSNILLSWPTQSVMYAVQQNPDFNPTHWLTLTNVPVVVGEENQVSIPKPDQSTFYRLISQ